METRCTSYIFGRVKCTIFHTLTINIHVTRIQSPRFHDEYTVFEIVFQRYAISSKFHRFNFCRFLINDEICKLFVVNVESQTFSRTVCPGELYLKPCPVTRQSFVITSCHQSTDIQIKVLTISLKYIIDIHVQPQLEIVNITGVEQHFRSKHARNIRHEYEFLCNNMCTRAARLRIYVFVWIWKKSISNVI